MPLTPISPSNTVRWWLDYTVNGDAHSLMMRTGTGATAAEVSSVFTDFFTLFTTDLLYGITVTGLRRASVGSDVTIPQTYSGTTSFGSGTAFDTDLRAKTFSFTGRALDGHKNKLFVYGCKIGANGDYRIQVGENGAIDDVIAYLQGAVSYWRAISGEQTIWNGYANTGWNDHWIKVARG